MQLTLTIKTNKKEIPGELYSLLVEIALPIISQKIEHNDNSIILILEPQSTNNRLINESSEDGHYRLLTLIKKIESKSDKEDSKIKAIRKKIVNGDIAIIYEEKYVINNFLSYENKDITVLETISTPKNGAIFQFKNIDLKNGCIDGKIDNNTANSISMPRLLLEFTAKLVDQNIPTTSVITHYNTGKKSYKLTDDSGKQLLDTIISCALEVRDENP